MRDSDRCCLRSCRAARSNDPMIALFRVPRKEKRREKFVAAITELDEHFVVRPYSRICSLHFENNQIMRNHGKTFLVKNALPSILGEKRNSQQPQKPKQPSPLPSPSVQIIDEESDEEYKIERENLILQKDNLTNFEGLIAEYKTKLDYAPYQVRIYQKIFTFFTVAVDETYGIKFKIRVVVSKAMTVRVFLFDDEILEDDIKVDEMTTIKITKWSQLQSILTKFKDCTQGTREASDLE